MLCTSKLDYLFGLSVPNVLFTSRTTYYCRFVVRYTVLFINRVESEFWHRLCGTIIQVGIRIRMHTTASKLALFRCELILMSFESDSMCMSLVKQHVFV